MDKSVLKCRCIQLHWVDKRRLGLEGIAKVPDASGQGPSGVEGGAPGSPQALQVLAIYVHFTPPVWLCCSKLLVVCGAGGRYLARPAR